MASTLCRTVLTFPKRFGAHQWVTVKRNACIRFEYPPKLQIVSSSTVVAVHDTRHRGYLCMRIFLTSGSSFPTQILDALVVGLPRADLARVHLSSLKLPIKLPTVSISTGVAAHDTRYRGHLSMMICLNCQSSSGNFLAFGNRQGYEIRR